MNVKAALIDMAFGSVFHIGSDHYLDRSTWNDGIRRLCQAPYTESFSVYVSFPNSYSIYGSLATPVVMMFWLYFCIYIFLIGAFINRFFHPAVKVLYDDHHKKVVRKNVKKKSTKVIRKHRDYNDFG